MIVRLLLNCVDVADDFYKIFIAIILEIVGDYRLFLNQRGNFEKGGING